MKIMLALILTAALAACGSKSKPSTTTPPDNAGTTETPPEGTGGTTYGGEQTPAPTPEGGAPAPAQGAE